MTNLLLRRSGSAVLILVGVTIIVFLLVQLVPGDPARAVLGSGATEESVRQLRDELGLNEPLAMQYLAYLGQLLAGDLGTSVNLGQPVTEIILPRLGNTMILAMAALLISVVAGVGVGVLAARRPHGLFDRISTFLAVAGASLPVYWAALTAIAVFSLSLQWFPTGGMYNARNPGGPADLLIHLVLPASISALVPLAIIARLTRSALLETLSQDYIRVLRASGISEASILWRHALRNVLPPAVNIIGLQVGYLLGGVIFVEVVFQWPGLGQQLYTSITANDLPVIQAGVLFIALVFVAVNLLTDVAVASLDPRGKAASS
ncbi:MULTISPECIES: ABC transporter permease [Arthrobacter]|uniref:ABC transporter permease n=1 Tax=Arthrobacter gengyunqii TaxID=2886940 RepID=A0ABS8GEE7_9MICC|nr:MULTISPECIES: ABC transporter permease [Arthrobacter]MCC3264800.1 ABC transporter permease [Arthrobacter gengyunqii]